MEKCGGRIFFIKIYIFSDRGICQRDKKVVVEIKKGGHKKAFR